MNVLVLATDEIEEELLVDSLNDTVQYHWIMNPEDLITHQRFDACIDMLFENTPGRIEWLNNLHSPLVIINSVITTLKDLRQDFIRINGWNTFLKRPVIEAAVNNETLKTKAEELFLSLGKKTDWVPDITGLITPRVVASIINEAFFALEEKVSTKEEIDTAMKLGTNYPFGPFEWSQLIGLQNVYSLLTALAKEQSRYQPSALLRQTALA